MKKLELARRRLLTLSFSLRREKEREREESAFLLMCLKAMPITNRKADLRGNCHVFPTGDTLKRMLQFSGLPHGI